MEVVPRSIDYYRRANGYCPYRQWFNGLKDPAIKVFVDQRLTRIERGLFGDCEPVGGNIYELKLHHGPGYRIYFGQKGKTVIILLCGGDKSTQKKDIPMARSYWLDYLRRQTI